MLRRLCLLAFLALPCTPATAGAEATAFRGANLVPMDAERVLPGHTVLVVDGRIAAIGPDADIDLPEGTRVVDAAGHWLIPGLGEAHGHLPPASSPTLQPTLDLYLAHGVTLVRGLLGEPGQLALRGELARGERFGPRIVIAGPSLNGNSVRDPEHARELVEGIARDGYDLLKIHPGLDIPRFDAIVETARRHDLPVVGHVPEAVGLLHALERRMDGIEHLDDYVRTLVPDGHPARTASAGWFGVLQAEVADPGRIPVLVEATRAAGSAMSPTETLMVSLLGNEDTDTLLARPEMVYMAPATLAQWRQGRANLRGAPGFTEARAERFLDLRRQLLLALHRGGVPIVLGSDAPQMFNVPGASAHRELDLMVAAGLSPYEALRTGTANFATHLGMAEARGTIAPGMAADLVLLSANPLEDIAHTRRIEGVMVDGRWHDRAALDARLDAIKASHR